MVVETYHKTSQSKLTINPKNEIDCYKDGANSGTKTSANINYI